MLIGYARVSTQDQHLDLQREALTKAGCQKIFEDKISGSRAERLGLAKTMEMLREGDTLVIWKLDRLGRSVKHLVDLASDLGNQGIHFKSLTDSMDTGTPSGRFFFHVMAFPVEVENFLHTNPAVKDVAAIGVPDERLGEIVAVVIDLVPGKTATEEEILQFCEGLQKYKRPRKIFFGEVPRNPTGKIEKVKLRKTYTGMGEAFKI